MTQNLKTAKGVIGQTFTPVVNVSDYVGSLEKPAKPGTVILRCISGTLPYNSSLLDPVIAKSVGIEAGKCYLLMFKQKENREKNDVSYPNFEISKLGTLEVMDLLVHLEKGVNPQVVTVLPIGVKPEILVEDTIDEDEIGG